MDYRAAGFDSRVGVKFWYRPRRTCPNPKASTWVEVDEATATSLVRKEEAPQAGGAAHYSIIVASYVSGKSVRMYDLHSGDKWKTSVSNYERVFQNATS